MQKLKVLRVEFDTEITTDEVPAFRGAVICKVGAENTLFHNHVGDTFRYRYPLIQYKRLSKRPAIVCVGEGVEDIHKFFGQTDWTLRIGSKEVEMKIARLDMNQFNIQVWDKTFAYSLLRWAALDEQSYQDYKEMTDEADRIRFLETKLVGNILSFAKGIGWNVTQRIVCNIREVKETYQQRMKDIRIQCFDILFESNVFLPNHIGLGKHVSIGFGTVMEMKK